MKSELKTNYADLEPSPPKNILSKIILPENDNLSPPNVYEYLLKYIKKANKIPFVRFCTGSNVANGTILLSFTNTEGFRRMPAFHTCSGVVELSLNYHFIDFISEMNSTLDSNIWVIDVV